MQQPATHMEAALYWSAVSLLVCDGLPIDKAAEQLGIEGAHLREILLRRQALQHADEPWLDTLPGAQSLQHSPPQLRVILD